MAQFLEVDIDFSDPFPQKREEHSEAIEGKHYVSQKRRGQRWLFVNVTDSINKLTDPYDNSINEKCARIKNAFVSEFREEVAQWYFIDGNRGEKKTIKLPRELVTWEIKD